MKRVLVIANEGQRNPSTRMRILQYLPTLEERGLAFETFFVPSGRISPPYESFRRLAGAVRAADLVFVQRVLRRPISTLLRQSHKPVIFDLDDATHYLRPGQFAAANIPILRNRLILKYRELVRGSKYFSSRKRLLDDMLDFCTVAIVGNRWLHDDLSRKGCDLVILPTAVWVDRSLVKEHIAKRPVTIGWTGVASNMFYLGMIEDSLRELGKRHGSDVRFMVLSSAPYRSDALDTDFVHWSMEAEQEALRTFDIGVMPLQDDPFSRGKCSFKAILCMSRGLPVVVSPVGANRELIKHGENGFLAATTAEWTEHLSELVVNSQLRARVGTNAVATIEASFSSETVVAALENILKSS